MIAYLKEKKRFVYGTPSERFAASSFCWKTLLYRLPTDISHQFDEVKKN